jgi:hypothetical protein
MSKLDQQSSQFCSTPTLPSHGRFFAFSLQENFSVFGKAIQTAGSVLCVSAINNLLTVLHSFHFVIQPQR